MLSKTFFEVIQNEGVVSITSWGSGDQPNVRCTWNSYLRITKDERILAPIAGFTSVQGDVSKNDRVMLTLGSREVEGFNNYQGTGFLIEGRARFTDCGAEFEQMQKEYPFMNKLLEITVESAKQLL
ncbi:pyridoxamine 5'-phosphate oxidase family protein [Carnobacterium viridans]|uniref:Pyridoxamine 5'-phosphate oxidase n=1 Tax=Carnobacterium viridans TaxID=174587 RepID=A0A1H0XYX3_9LACT|nr:pyridoxamine 5'-phosphate oxidase family protein [Carnobacterium viridans]UDE95440.1 pyridoxamine 5'-phosphate oxidase family protein [Carnobacterium viridans]SDQ08083.1 Pyridoxamine 5'-phosphate oxidase [Carnobacterium viridans]